MLAVGADGIDGAVVALDLTNGCEVVHIPDLDEAGPAGAQQHGPAGYKGQGAHPVLVSVGDLLDELLLVQVPLLDAIVSGATEEYVSLDGDG